MRTELEGDGISQCVPAMRKTGTQVSLSSVPLSKYANLQPLLLAAYLVTACSLQCSKDHKSACIKQPEISNEPALHNDLAGEAVARKPLEPLGGLLSLDSITSRPELQELFMKYPKLQDQVRGIYESSIDQHSSLPRASNTFRGRGRGFHQGVDRISNQQWTKEKGIDNGVRRLQQHLKAGSAHSDGLVEFCKTIKTLRVGNSHSHAI